MIAAFLIWTVISLILLGIGILDWRSEKAVGFFTGVKPPEVTDIRKYNHTVAVLWFVYAFFFELLGLPFLFLKQNSAGFLLCVLCVPLIFILLMIAYTVILAKYRAR